MNNKGGIVTYLPFKKYLTFVLIILVIWLVYYFFILKSFGIITLPKSCPEEVIPERIKLDLTDDVIRCIYEVNSFGYRVGNCLNAWKDGTKMGFISCSKGTQEGENVNYIYCKNLVYENQPVSSTGEIEKKISFKIDLVVNPLDLTEEGYKIIEHKCKS